jgi:hypothetical protein
MISYFNDYDAVCHAFECVCLCENVNLFPHPPSLRRIEPASCSFLRERDDVFLVTFRIMTKIVGASSLRNICHSPLLLGVL